MGGAITSSKRDASVIAPSHVYEFVHHPLVVIAQAILHWDIGESTQLVAPMAIGLLLFDMVYMVALLYKLKMI